MEKIKNKTAVGKFLDQFSEDIDQNLTLDIKKKFDSVAKNSFGESLIFELPSGKKIKFIAKIVDFAKCKIWSGNVRIQDFLTPDNTASLKEKIKSQGQLVPVLARPVKEDLQYTHEIIYGSRRHYVCKQLGINIKILEADLDDHDALLFMDAENSGRESLSPYEQAMAYKFWLDNNIFNNQSELAQKIGITREWANKIISLAKIPKSLIVAIEDPKKLSLTQGLLLSKHIASMNNVDDETKNIIDKINQLKIQKYTTEEILQQIIEGKHKQNINHINNKTNVEQHCSQAVCAANGEIICQVIRSKQGKTTLAFNDKLPTSTIEALLTKIIDIIKKI